MRLAVNIDHIATIREARKALEPQPVAAAVMAELAGAEGITVHLRGDRRHINETDVSLLRQIVRTKLNVEMAATSEMIGIALRLRPDQVTLVPERPQEVTTEGGLDVVGQFALVADAVAQLRGGGLRVSIFIDPAAEQVARSKAAGPSSSIRAPMPRRRPGDPGPRSPPLPTARRWQPCSSSKCWRGTG
jgi:pyridoxine 5-phosphate synthase